MADWSKYATGSTVPNDPDDDLPAIAPGAPKTDWSQYEVKAAPPTAAAPAASAEPPRTLMGRILDAIHPIVSGVNEGATTLAGLPGTVSNNIVNLGKSAIEGGYLATGHLPPTALDPVDNAKVPLTGEWLKAKAEQIAPGSTSDPNHPIQHFIGSLLGPGGVAHLGSSLAEHAPGLIDSLAGTEATPVPANASSVPPVVGAPSDAAPLQTARGLGFKTTASNVALTNPTQKPGILNQTGEILSGGNSAITRANRSDNVARATQLAGDQLGLGPNVTKINIPDLDKTMGAPAADYAATAGKVGDFTPSPNLTNLLSDAQADQSVQAAPASRTAAKNILQTIAANGGKYSGADAIGDISKLRENPSTRPIANMLEDEMGRQLGAQGDGAALTKYQNARRQFAQILTVRDALRGGQVDPQALLAADPKLQFLTGNLRGIASAANELPNDVRLPNAAPEGTLDAILNKAKGIAGSVVRPFMRSNAVQSQFGPVANAGGESYFKTFGLPPGADEPPVPNPLKLALSPGKVGQPTPVQAALPLPQPTTGAFTKPQGMSDKDWNLLTKLGFGK